MKVVAIIQARMGSSRLPGKVLEDLSGRTMIERVVERVSVARSIDEIVIATTTAELDDALVELAHGKRWLVGRGSENDVLDRFYTVAKERCADAIVRITADCPLIDPDVIDAVVSTYLSADDRVDYTSNVLHSRTFPRGLDTEVFSFDVLRAAWSECASPGWREHVTPFIWNQPDRFRLRAVTNDIDRSNHRWTVDTAEDLKLAREVYRHFRHVAFGWRDVLEFLDREPDIRQLNANVRQKVVPRRDEAA